MAAQSVKNTDTAALKGYDAGKKVSGIKRWGAARPAWAGCKACSLTAANAGDPFAQAVKETLGETAAVQIAKRGEWHKFAVILKRWMVERGFAWLDKNRRLWKNCERHLTTSLQFIHLAFLALLLRRS